MTITVYGRLCYMVQSETRKNLVHLVDLEGFEEECAMCGCEAAYWLHHRPCKHIRAVLQMIADELQPYEPMNTLAMQHLERACHGNTPIIDAILFVANMKPVRPEQPKRKYTLKSYDQKTLHPNSRRSSRGADYYSGHH